MKKKVTLIGSGNVAESLVRALSGAENYELIQIFSRNRERGAELASMCGAAHTDRPEEWMAADIHLIAVSDSAIREVSGMFRFGQSVVAHTAGSCTTEELSDKIRHRGVFYPLQTFTAGVRQDFRRIPLFIEGADDRAREELTALAEALSDSVTPADASTRMRLHLAAVFVCNFVNRMYVTGEKVLRREGLDFSLLKPLIAETTRKVLESPSPAPLQTGPAVRGDRATVEKHLRLLADVPSVRYLYEMITKDITNDTE